MRQAETRHTDMTVSHNLSQIPEPGTRHLIFRGDVITFRLRVPGHGPGTAWLRTNLGGGGKSRQEITGQVENKQAPMYMDWSDIAMVSAGSDFFELTLPAVEVGHFEAKACFLPRESDLPIWPPGPNTIINVEPAETVCANIIYNAFVRQFGPNKHKRRQLPSDVDLKILDQNGYTVIPPSGKFRDLIAELDFIITRLGCRYIQLLPVHPTPTTYGRMGRFGSPYAAQGFTSVDPAMAEFDPAATPLEQFVELVNAVHARRARILLDIAINHTGWGAAIHETHPEWLDRGKDGKIKMPGAWGIVWEDLTKLDYRYRDLWKYMAEVFLTWCRRGVDGFRCDAGYMIPVEAWRYIVAKVRQQFPDTLFFLEGLGGKISVTRDILDAANFNWAYSELFQNYSRDQVYYQTALIQDIASSDGQMINFAETHDNNRLASVSERFARMRTALAALLSKSGGFAFANGVEWFATEKIDVHDAAPLNWGSSENQVDHISRLTSLLKTHSAFTARASQRFVMTSEGNFLALLRHAGPGENPLVVLINLDADNKVTARWEPVIEPVDNRYFLDFISGQRIFAQRHEDDWQLDLDPGQAMCLGSDYKDFERIKAFESQMIRTPEAILHQQLRAAAMEVFVCCRGMSHIDNFDPDEAAKKLCRDPEAFLREINPQSNEPRAVIWQWPEDSRRQVMIPPGHFLLVRAESDFRVQVSVADKVISSRYAMGCEKGSYFALVSPGPDPGDHQEASLHISLYSEGKTISSTSHLLYLAPLARVGVHMELHRSKLMDRPFIFLAANGRGAMMRASTYARRMRSRYDALLGANCDASTPVDRWIMLTRCRIWLVYQDYTQAVRTDCLRKFFYSYDCRACWQYMIPTGLGRYIRFFVKIKIFEGQNRVRLDFFRPPGHSADMLGDQHPVRMILRPDMENRSFHETTKAYTGPEHQWPAAVEARENGFLFRPDPDHAMGVYMPGVEFIPEPEWQYMEYRPMEAERGLDPNSDLFSPGYFNCRLAGGDRATLEASMDCTDPPQFDKVNPAIDCQTDVPFFTVTDAMERAMEHYIVKRGSYASVIAGYPWFLDWGRDSLIFCRGVIESGDCKRAEKILRMFGQYEQSGTLPNMIHGHDARNRDTSDASLWFIIACRDLAQKFGSTDFLNVEFEGRSLYQIVFSIVAGYMRGTPNGIYMDHDSGLIFSPAHFTWMDTNYPAATPRQGYPVEIQALWYACLKFISGLSVPGGAGLVMEPALCADKVAKSIIRCYVDKNRGYLSDCLHCSAGTGPDNALADDALRPNQLFALTMEAVTDPEICSSVLAACARLLVPGAIRSLADQTLAIPLEIKHNGQLLADPYRPYKGNYTGDEDFSRKPAYHNGTAWTWVFPSFCEAWAMVYGEKSIATAQNLLASSIMLINQGCLGHVPEIVDGDYPHAQRGCDAQAWGVSELYRVLKKLESVRTAL